MDVTFLKTIFILGHIFGAVIGAGGALYSDLVFIRSLKDKKIDHIELGFLKIMGIAVWIGLVLLIGSGIGLFFLDPQKYIESSKFIAKMVIVIVILINGIFFHTIHIQFMEKRARIHKRLMTNAPRYEDAKLILSGVISVVSWISTLILGSLQSVNLPYTVILSLYIGLILGGTISSIFIMKKFLTQKAKRFLLWLSILIGGLGIFLFFLEI